MTEIIYHARMAIASISNWPSMLPSSPKPFLANISLTDNCNSRCIMCNYWRSASKNDITQDRAVKLLGELKSIGVKYVRFTGGEPLLRKDIFEILRSQPDGAFKRVTLATNGLLASRYIEEINESIITNVTISIDGIGESNDHIRGVAGYYEKAISAIGKLNKKVKIVSIATKSLARDIGELIKICKDRGMDYDINLPNNDLPFLNDKESIKAIGDNWPDESDVEKIFCAMRESGLLTPSVERFAREYFANPKIRLKHCALGFVELNVGANGDISGGCHLLEPVGNILNSSIDSIVKSKKYKEHALSMFKMECPGCVCGFAISDLYENPWGKIGYLLRRLK